MVVVMAADATPEDVARVVARVESVGGTAHVSTGVSRTIVGLVGDLDAFHHLNLRSLPGVADVHQISDPYKLISRQHHPDRSTVWIGTGDRRTPIGAGTFTLLAGPGAVESVEQLVQAAQMARAAGATIIRGSAFLPRTTPGGFTGLGIRGLEILASVGESVGLPVMTEVLDASEVGPATEFADLLQVGAQSMDNLALLRAVGEAGTPVLIERGTGATVEEWLMRAEYVAQHGNLDIVLCERGIRTFEQSTPHTLDLTAVPVAQQRSHLPVVVDPSHAAGRPELVVPLARAAIAVGADGLAVAVHPHPEDARCDGAQSLLGSHLREVAQAVRQLPGMVGRCPADPRSLVG